jgi:hypothetical protein
MIHSTLRKLSILFLSANFLLISVKAQVQFGVKTGMSVSDVLTTSSEVVFIGGSPQTVRFFPAVGFEGGVLLSIPLSTHFAIEPEVGFSAQGAYNNPPGDYTVGATETYSFHWIQFPLLLKWHSPWGYYIETGPQLGLLLSASIEESVVGATNLVYYNVKNQYKSSDIGWTLGTGYLFPYNIGLDVRYILGLSNFSNVSGTEMQSAPVQSGSIKNSAVQISIYYFFGKHKTEIGPPSKSNPDL